LYDCKYVLALSPGLLEGYLMTTPPKKLKRARGALLRAIRAGLIPPPPGYQGPEEMAAAEMAALCKKTNSDSRRRKASLHKKARRAEQVPA
jgi:hypothetical protein